MSRFLASPVALRRLALASVVANVGIVITGGAVRLTASGLGCPTWPGCTDASYLPTPALGVHGVIEFGNRLLAVVVGLIALAGLVAALLQRPRRRALTWPAALVLLGIPAQAVVGMVTVRTDLNPWVVGCHFLVSMAVLAAAYAFWWAAREPAHTPNAPAGRTYDLAREPEAGGVLPAPLRALAWLITAVAAAVLVVGTFVTGSGPHAGDADAKRNGLDPATISQVHADLVFLLLGLSVALWFALRAVPGPGAAAAARAGAVLVAVELAQGAVGFVQHFTGLPVLAVGLHMLGACLVWLSTLAVLSTTRRHHLAPLPAPTPPAQAGRPAMIGVSGPKA